MSLHRFLVLGLALAAVGSGCQSTARNVMYSAYEKVGVQKRDLLKDRIDDARDEQKEAGESFTDALDRLRAMYDIEGGELEKEYDRLKNAYDDANGEAEDVRNSIAKVETVANDLFKEWEKEAQDIETSDLRSKSRERLAETRRRYQDLHSSLKTAEARMEPVLAKFKDQVLYLKHNLNAQAISSLKTEAKSIEGDIEQLMKKMNASISEADKFIAQLP